MEVRVFIIERLNAVGYYPPHCSLDNTTSVSLLGLRLNQRSQDETVTVNESQQRWLHVKITYPFTLAPFVVTSNHLRGIVRIWLRDGVTTCLAK